MNKYFIFGLWLLFSIFCFFGWPYLLTYIPQSAWDSFMGTDSFMLEIIASWSGTILGIAGLYWGFMSLQYPRTLEIEEKKKAARVASFLYGLGILSLIVGASMAVELWLFFGADFGAGTPPFSEHYYALLIAAPFLLVGIALILKGRRFYKGSFSQNDGDKTPEKRT